MNDFKKEKGLSGLDSICFAELKSSDKLIQMLTEKVHDLDPSRFENQLLEKRIRCLLELLRETLADRYQGLSIRAFAHILVALDHFLQVHDAIPDTHDNGYKDDLQAIEPVFINFKRDIDTFQAWHLRQQKNSAW